MVLSFVADALRALGHSAVHAAESASGKSDTDLLDAAAAQGCVRVTNDKDFGDLVFRRRRPSSGVILMRQPGKPGSVKARLVAQAVVRYGERLLGAFLVIGTRTMRLRRIPE